eukprot:scaffold88174_cov57-Attheya_sp.AAC.1
MAKIRVILNEESSHGRIMDTTGWQNVQLMFTSLCWFVLLSPMIQVNCFHLIVTQVPRSTSPFVRRPSCCAKPCSSTGTFMMTDGTNHREAAPKDDTRRKAYLQQTPHSGRHFWPSHPAYKDRPRFLKRNVKKKRFMEGWYYRLTLPEEQVSFAFIFSIEDMGLRAKSNLTLAAVQVMGPNDEYLVQADRDDTKFWAWEGQQGLGCTFQWSSDDDDDEERLKKELTTAMHPEEWRNLVKSGFQMLPNSLQGRVDGHDGSLGGVYDGQGVAGSCEFDITVDPIVGWGDNAIGAKGKTAHQKSTAGWLASSSVFEPHWQVTMADGRATGSVRWKNTTYNFADAPFYAEKNWGGSFPSKWYWAQCNAFDGYTEKDGTHLSVTAGGGTRKIPLGKTEDLGMVSVHYNGTFYEAVPWTGTMEWDVSPWGRWVMTGKCTSGPRLFEVKITAHCDPEKVPGVVLRAPTLKDGMVYFCKDSFLAETTLSLWELTKDKVTKELVRVDGPPIIDCAKSSQGAVEVGGGPWWNDWKGVSDMKQPMKGLVRFPYAFQRIKRKISPNK